MGGNSLWLLEKKCFFSKRVRIGNEYYTRKQFYKKKTANLILENFIETEISDSESKYNFRVLIQSRVKLKPKNKTFFVSK